MTRKIPFFSESTAKQLVGLLGKRPNQSPLPSNYINAADEQIVFRNDSAETVPAYGVMRVTGSELLYGRYINIINKPNGTYNTFLFNGPTEVPAGEMGTAQSGRYIRAYYTSGTPAARQTWGPESGWVITSAGIPAIMLYGSAVDTNIAMGQTTRISDSDLFKAPSGGLTARSGTTLGTGTCDLLDETLTDTTYNITVKNWAKTTVCDSGDRYGWAKEYHGVWFCIAEDCSDT